MSYATFNVVQWTVAAIALVLAVITIVQFARKPRKMGASTAVVIVLWGLLPPIWFFCVYYAADHGWFTNLPLPNDKMLESVKTYADYASKIWAAVLAAVLFLVKKD